MEPKNILGPVIKDLRKENHLTQTALSKLTGFKQNTISQHESQKRDLAEGDVRKYAKAFNTSVQALYDRLSNDGKQISKKIAENKDKESIKDELNLIVDRISIEECKQLLNFAYFELGQHNKDK